MRAAIAATAVLLMLVSSMDVTLAAAAKPNILFVMADDLDNDYKQPHLNIMPNLRTHWAEAGAHFVNHAAAFPVCGPSRSSLLAGRYSHNTHYVNNKDGKSYDAWARIQNNTFGTWLSSAGYHTAFLGKYVNGMSNDWVAGWSRWGGFDGGAKTYNFYNSSIRELRFKGESNQQPILPPKVHPMEGIHQADFLGNVTLDEVKLAVQAGKPFAIHVTPVMVHWGTCNGPCPGGQCYGPDDPHWEFTLKDGARTVAMPCDPCPTHRHAHTFDSLTAPHTPAWNRTASGGIPEFMAHAFPPLDEFHSQREDMCFRNRSSSAVDLDDMLGVIIDGLRDMNVLDNTIVIFTSDNGFHLGEHNMPFGKGEPYTTDVSLPFYIAGPGVAKGVIRHHPTNHMDITKTIMDIAGATPVGPPLDGKSMVPALGETPVPVESWRTWQYSEFFAQNNTWQALRLVNTTALQDRDPHDRSPSTSVALHRWCTGEVEVFNMGGGDQWQLSNLGDTAPTPFGEAIKKQYLPMLSALGQCSGADCQDPTPGAVSPLACYETTPPTTPVSEWDSDVLDGA